MGIAIGIILSTCLCGTASGPCGSVYCEGEEVLVAKPVGLTASEGLWRALDDCLTVTASGEWSPTDAAIDVGPLPVGWHRIEFSDASGAVLGFTTAAVLAPQLAPPPADTPIAVDVALSWVPEPDPTVWECLARLARLAGVGMVRDRLRWRDIQPEAGPLVEETRYNQTAAIQQAQGLQVLQVFHDAPAWTREDASTRSRVPTDLRDAYRFCRDAAARFNEEVQAWQPWNEGNSENFGGHAIDELCSHQKAAFLGFRAGNPQVTVCWAPLGGVNSAALCQGIIENGAAAYFDVYSMHSYDWAHDYPRLRKGALEAAAGKPLWVTESDRGIQADPASTQGDLSHENERLKAAFVLQSIASSLASGAARHFHFILPQYMEQHGTIQFGLLRHDHTPRMGYVALAAAGRFLAGARYLGRLYDPDQPNVYLFAFRAQPDGVSRDVLTAWTEAPVDWAERGRAVADLKLPPDLPVVSAWDYLGRPLGETAPERLTGAPVFLVLPEGAASSLPLQEAATRTAATPETPSPVVLQFRAPEARIQGRIRDWAHEQDRVMTAGEHQIDVNAYHFGQEETAGTVRVASLPEGWRCEPESWELRLAPMQRVEQTLRIHIPEPGPPAEEGVLLVFEGDFGVDGRPRLAVRILPDSEESNQPSP